MKYEIKTCGSRVVAEFDDYMDLLQHIKYFDPGLGYLFVYCNGEEIAYMSTKRNKLILRG